MKCSITMKLAFSSVVSVLAVMVISGAISYVDEKSRLEQALERTSLRVLERLSNDLQLSLYQFDYQLAETTIRSEMADESVSSIVVESEFGQTVMGMRKDEHGEIRNINPEEKPRGQAGECGITRSRMLTYDLKMEGRAPVNLGKVQLCTTDAPLKASLRSLISNQILETALLSLALCTCLFVSLRFVLIRPILAIRSAVGRFEQMDFSSRFNSQSRDELGELGRFFNKMADTIQHHSDNLEQQIEARTLELVHKNELIEHEVEVAEAATRAKTQLLTEQALLIKKLEDTQGQLLQSEKMASIGQLAAGVAHEINNPIGFIHSNLGSLQGQVDSLLAVIDAYKQSETVLSGHLDLLDAIRTAKKNADFDFLREDILSLISESQDGVHRVKSIVDSLKNFSRVDSSEWVCANLEDGLDSTLNIAWNEIKYKADVVKEYAGLPDVECVASQINQVFLNLLINAAHSIEERGTITLRTGVSVDEVWVEIEDTGHGIPPEHLHRIFEPFFTTKPVGKGTGLGLSLAYGIVQRHGGKLDVRSDVGKGTVFRLTLPINRLPV